jgi:hypothetical protein
MKWVDALKVYNTGKTWCVPRKGSPEHAEVMKIMGKSKVESPAAPVAAAKMSVSKAEAVKQIKAHKEKEGKVSSMAAKVKERKAMNLLKTLVAVRRAKKAEAATSKQLPLVKNLTDAENNYLIKFMKSTPTDAVMVLSGNLSDSSPSTIKVYKKFYGKVELALPFDRTYIYHDKSKKQLIARKSSGYHG